MDIQVYKPNIFKVVALDHYPKRIHETENSSTLRSQNREEWVVSNLESGGGGKLSLGNFDDVHCSNWGESTVCDSKELSLIQHYQGIIDGFVVCDGAVQQLDLVLFREQHPSISILEHIVMELHRLGSIFDIQVSVGSWVGIESAVPNID